MTNDYFITNELKIFEFDADWLFINAQQVKEFDGKYLFFNDLISHNLYII